MSGLCEDSSAVHRCRWVGKNPRTPCLLRVSLTRAGIERRCTVRLHGGRSLSAKFPKVGKEGHDFDRSTGFAGEDE